MSYQHPFNGVVPDLVEDVSLKRVRTAVNGEDAIRVVSAGSGGLDSQGVADAMGKRASQVLNSSVLGNLDLAVVHTEEISRDTRDIDSNVSSLEYTLSHDILDTLVYSDTYLSNINTATGTRSDAAWSGTGNGTVIALLKGIYNKL